MKIDQIDHLVLTVSDLEKTLDFYYGVLGLEPVEFKKDRMALHFGDQKINLHVVGQNIVPRANVAKPGTADLCFVTSTLIQEVISELEKNSIEILEGPVERIGATGAILSVYLRDPDMNLIEISNRL